MTGGQMMTQGGNMMDHGAMKMGGDGMMMDHNGMKMDGDGMMMGQDGTKMNQIAPMIAMPSMKQRNMTPPITVRRLRVRGAVTGLNRPGQQTAILRPLRTSSSIDEAPFGAKTETAAMVPHIAVRSCNVPVRPSPHDPGALQDRPLRGKA